MARANTHDRNICAGVFADDMAGEFFFSPDLS